MEIDPNEVRAALAASLRPFSVEGEDSRIYGADGTEITVRCPLDGDESGSVYRAELCAGLCAALNASLAAVPQVDPARLAALERVAAAAQEWSDYIIKGSQSFGEPGYDDWLKNVDAAEDRINRCVGALSAVSQLRPDGGTEE